MHAITSKFKQLVFRDVIHGVVGNLRGHWPHRINQEHRLVYRIVADMLIIVQCRYHYDDK
ncbi:MAG: hypothetical protein EOP54_31090 [Sphingobacteriales bacterium]|nr:MAG: hypothetical protein EOP54_31090 [Sphingobacteriales bacterium]